MNGFDWEKIANKAAEKIGLKCSKISLESETKTGGTPKELLKRNRNVLNKKIRVYLDVINHYETEVLRLRQRVSDITRNSVADEASRELLIQRREYMLQEYHNRYRNRYNDPEARAYLEKIKRETGNIPNVTSIDVSHIITDRRISYDLKEVYDYAHEKALDNTNAKSPTVKIEAPWQGDIKTLIDYYESIIKILENQYLEPLQKRLDKTNCFLYE